MKHSLTAALILITLFLSAGQASALPRKTVPAKAAVVMDAYGTVLYAKFPKAKLAPASTVKLVTAMVAIDTLGTDVTVTISRNASRVKTIPPGLCPEEVMTVSDLLHLALMKSINQAAVALAEAAAGNEDDFAVLMNQKAMEVGAADTRFANASGLPKGTQYTTANDLALIMKAALSYPLIREILSKKEFVVRTAAGREICLENSNHLLWQEQAMIIGKTGYTGNARHCFVGMVDTENGPVFTAVLGARSRASLWRTTSLLAEVGVHPELAQVLETAPVARGSGSVRSRKNRTVTAELHRDEISAGNGQAAHLLRSYTPHLSTQ